MVENNTELLFTDDEIMKALMKMSPEKRRLALAIPYSDLCCVANSTEYAQNFINICNEYIEGYVRVKDSVCEFLGMLQEQTAEEVFDEMAKTFKELPREEQLNFCKNLTGESNIKNSLDVLNYGCKHLIDTLQKVAKV